MPDLGAEVAGALGHDGDSIRDVFRRHYGEPPSKLNLRPSAKQMLVPNYDRFASQWGAGLKAYWSRFDEGLRDNWINSINLTRSEFVYELLRHRQWPVAGLSWKIEVDDSKDPDQQRAKDVLSGIIEHIPSFQAMRLYLGEHLWYGKYGAQLAYGAVRIDGKRRTTIVDHEPVNGDAIVYKYDKTPGIMVRAGWHPAGEDVIDPKWIEKPNASWIQPVDRGLAIFLYDQWWRDHFVITNFEPFGADYQFEGDKALSIFGLGLRGRLYWALQHRDTLRGWLYDALQRIGVNGMLYAFYEDENTKSLDATLLALKLLIRDNVTAFPKKKGQEVPDEIKHIEPSSVGYDIIYKEVERLEECMRRAVLGQSLTSETRATGMGSQVAELHRSTFEHVLRYDAQAMGEALNRDLIKPLIRYNSWCWRGRKLKGFVPFGMRLAFNLEQADTVERMQVYRTAVAELNVPVSREQFYDDCSLSPPKNPSDALGGQQLQMSGLPGLESAGVPGAPVAHVAPSPGLPGANGHGGIPKLPGLPGRQAHGVPNPRMPGSNPTRLDALRSRRSGVLPGVRR